MPTSFENWLAGGEREQEDYVAELRDQKIEREIRQLEKQLSDDYEGAMRSGASDKLMKLRGGA